MGCKILSTTGPLVIHDHQTCIACRAEYVPGSIQILLQPGIYYPKCTLIVEPEGVDCEPGKPIENVKAEKKRIVGVTTCDIDLRDVTEKDNEPCGIGTNMGLDPNYMCWPAGTPKADIDQLCRTAKGCIWFINRMHCSEVPDEFAYLLETKEVAKARAEIKTTGEVEAVRN